MQTSARRAISYPDLTRGDRPDVPAHLYNLVQALELDVIFAQGTDAQRGASGYQIGGGRFWWTTDTNLLWYDDGNNWHRVTVDLSGLNAILLSLINAKGDLIVGAANDDPEILPVGTPGQIIVADPAATLGIKWTDRDWISLTQAASFGSADGPTFTMNVVGIDLTSVIGPKTRIKVLQTTNKYFIVTAISFGGGNTLITMYGGTDYVLANAAITTLAYSNQHTPPGFPNQGDKWTVRVEDSSIHTINNPAANTWVNPGISISLPIGSWQLRHRTHVRSQYSSPQGECTIGATLSTNTSGETDHSMTGGAHAGNNNNSANKMGADLFADKLITVTSKTQYNLLIKAYDTNCLSIAANGSICGSIILEARCMYL